MQHLEIPGIGITDGQQSEAVSHTPQPSTQRDPASNIFKSGEDLIFLSLGKVEITVMLIMKSRNKDRHFILL